MNTSAVTTPKTFEICELLKKKRWVNTSELGPPKGTDLKEFDTKTEILRGCVDGVNVTDQQAAIMRLSSLASCIRLAQKGMNPILQITVRDKNRLALQSELLAAAVFGIRNLLVLTGDPVKIGDHPESKIVFDLDAVGLMSAAKTLESGKDLAGNALTGSPQFCIAGAANPCVDDLDTEFSKLKNKIQHGAEMFQTQGVFDAKLYGRFADRMKDENIDAPIIAGIILLKSAKMARYMNAKIPGIVIPETLIERMEKTNDPKQECVRIASETMLQIKDRVAGFHLMAIGWEEVIPEILKKSGF